MMGSLPYGISAVDIRLARSFGGPFGGAIERTRSRGRAASRRCIFGGGGEWMTGKG
jgi:hypothetical protein